MYPAELLIGGIRTPGRCVDLPEFIIGDIAIDIFAPDIFVGLQNRLQTEIEQESCFHFRHCIAQIRLIQPVIPRPLIALLQLHKQGFTAVGNTIGIYFLIHFHKILNIQRQLILIEHMGTAPKFIGGQILFIPVPAVQSRNDAKSSKSNKPNG